jgi:outer membrane protein TolC
MSCSTRYLLFSTAIQHGHARKITHILLAVVSLVFLLPAMTVAAGLSLIQAEQLALQYDPVLKAQAQQLQAVEQETVAADTWEDPRLRIGIMDVPTDSFDISAEPMTKLQLGYQQMLPRGDTSDLKVRKKLAQQQQKTAVINLRRREVKMNARKAWLDLYAQQQTEKILLASRQIFSQQLEVSQSLYAAGRSNQQDVLQAELELSLVDDKLQKVAASKREKLARLIQVIGTEAANQTLDDRAGIFKTLDDDKILEEQLKTHPALQQQEAVIAGQTEEVSLARQKFRPQWGFDLTYTRGDANTIGSVDSSTMSFMLMFDLPVFTGNLQDRELAASQQRLQSERYVSQDVMLQLTSQLEQNLARWQQLTQRLALYDARVLSQAQQNARAALKGYQSGVVSFEATTRARGAELEAQMQRLDLYIEKARVFAQVMYLTAD